jgi:lysophospholipase L1-like esterase
LQLRRNLANYDPHLESSDVMRRVILLAVVLAGLMITAVAIGMERPRTYVAQGPGDIYLALGDSLAWGASLEDRASQSYPALIHRQLQAERPIILQNIALPGATSVSMLRGQVPRAIALIDAARTEGLRVSPITIGIGGNDLRNVERAGPQARTAAIEVVARNLDRSLTQLRAAAGPDADIVLMTYYNPYGGDPQDPASDAYWVEQLNAVIAAEAAQHGIALADVYQRFGAGRAYTHTYILLGDVHANAAGQELIAAAFVEALDY